MAFVVADRCGSFVVHHHLDTFARCVTMYFFYIEIRIRSNEVEYIVLAIAEPVFPTFIPAFYQYSVEPVCCGEVNIAFHVGSVGRMFAVRFGFRVIRFSQFYAGQFVGISP